MEENGLYLKSQGKLNSIKGEKKPKLISTGNVINLSPK